MPNTILKSSEEKMDKAIDNLKKELTQVRTGRANPAILDTIMIDYYGSKTPVKQVSQVTAPEASQLYIKPYDKSQLKDIEQAILASNIGITPQNDGNGLRLVFPQMTEERRKELAKGIKKYEEQAKVAVRNIRRDANDSLKKLSLPIDEENSYLEDVQKLTDKKIVIIEEETKKKEKELLSM